MPIRSAGKDYLERRIVGTEGDRNVKLQERIDIDLEDLLVKLPSNIQGVIRD